jgi:hypothetical protein
MLDRRCGDHGFLEIRSFAESAYFTVEVVSINLFPCYLNNVLELVHPNLEPDEGEPMFPFLCPQLVEAVIAFVDQIFCSCESRLLRSFKRKEPHVEAAKQLSGDSEVSSTGRGWPSERSGISQTTGGRRFDFAAEGFRKR